MRYLAIIVRRTVRAGNRMVRDMARILIFWPILMFAAALWGNQIAIGIVTLLPLAALVLGILAYVDPHVFAIIAAAGAEGRAALRWATTAIGVELLLGAYLFLVPVYQDRTLVLLFGSVLLAIFFLGFANDSPFKKRVTGVGWLALAVITAIWLAGGRSAVKAEVQNLRSGRGATWNPFADYPICGDTEPGVQAILPGMVKVQLHMECWSGPVSLPDTAERFRLRVHNGSGELNYQFPDGREKHFGRNTNAPVGHIPWPSFRLRGEGVAAITLTPLSQETETEAK